MPTTGDDPDRSAPGHPSPNFWADLGIVPVAEIHAGHQSTVFRATGDSGPLLVKLIDGRPDETAVARRVEIVRRLAEINPAVVGPVAVRSNLVNSAGNRQVICYPFVEGRRPNTDDRHDVEAMATALATLHQSLATVTMTVTDPALPPVAALEDQANGDQSPDRIIHGDYGAPNLIVTPDGLRIIDFDDCGRGSVEFEIGNSLYLELFDAWNSADIERYHRFRRRFVNRYRTVAPPQPAIDNALIDDAITIRANALDRWLTNPHRAPAGIRAASPAWRQRLHAFLGEVADVR